MLVRIAADRVEVQAPAKINLFLEILAKRPDGYHEIETLMSRIGLYDSLSFRGTESPEISLDARWTEGSDLPHSGELQPLGDLPPQKKTSSTKRQAFCRKEAAVGGGRRFASSNGFRPRQGWAERPAMRLRCWSPQTLSGH